MKDCTIPECGKLPDLRDRRVVVGLKQLKKSLNKGIVADVYLAQDADPAITETLSGLCESRGVSVTWCRSMADLGKACGIDVGASAAAILK